MQYADVAIASRRGRYNMTLTYAIPAELLVGVYPGVVVEVPFRQIQAIGVVRRLRAQLPEKSLRGRLRPIRRLLSPWPLFSAEELALRERLAASTLQPASLFLTLGLPPKSLYNKLLPPKKTVTLPGSRRWFRLIGPLDRPKAVFSMIQKSLAHERSVLVIAPTEESVTQWKNVLAGLVPQPIVHYRSGMKSGEELAVWQIVFGQNAGVVIGTRSASLLPYTNLGVTIIDQPSHPLLREEQAPYYRVLDVVRGRQDAIGYHLLALDSLPPWDLFLTKNKKEWSIGNELTTLPSIQLIQRTSSSQLTDTTARTISQALGQNKRVLFFAPDRGWANGVVCQDCGWIARCATCSSVIGGQPSSSLSCTICKAETPFPTRCAHCRGLRLQTFGWGAQRWLDQLVNVFPHHHVVSYQTVIPPTGSWDILICSQSWLRLPALLAHLVVAIEPERLLLAQTYKATEDWIRFLVDLRGHATEELLIETRAPNHPLLHALAEPIPRQSIRDDLETRRRYGYPPFGSLLEIQLATDNAKEAQTKTIAISELSQQLIPAATVLGPIQLAGALVTWKVLVKLPNTTPHKQHVQFAQALPADMTIKYA